MRVQTAKHYTKEACCKINSKLFYKKKSSPSRELREGAYGLTLYFSALMYYVQYSAYLWNTLGLLLVHSFSLLQGIQFSQNKTENPIGPTLVNNLPMKPN